MAHVTVIDPPYVAKLSAGLKRKIPGAQITHEQVRRDRYRFIVVSRKFDRLGHPERQRMVWEIAQAVLQKNDLMSVAMILTIGTQEVAALSE